MKKIKNTIDIAKLQPINYSNEIIMLNNIENEDIDDKMVQDIDLSDKEPEMMQDIDLSDKQPKTNNQINIKLGSDYSVRIGTVNVNTGEGVTEKNFQFNALLLSKKYKDENGSDKYFTFSVPIRLIPKLHSAIGMILEQNN